MRDMERRRNLKAWSSIVSTREAYMERSLQTRSEGVAGAFADLAWPASQGKGSEIIGVPPGCAQAIRERCQGSTAFEAFDVLPVRYEALESSVAEYGCCEKSLKKALLACEAPDTEVFEKAWVAVVNKLISRPLEPVDHVGAKLELENIQNDLKIYLSKTSGKINSE